MEKFKALQVSEVEEKKFSGEIIERDVSDLPEGEVLIRVQYSSLNYKDALSASGNKGVTRNFPHTPGIDAAGVVISSQSDSLAEGDEVIVTGYDLGMNTSGGFGQLIRVPADWVVKCPAGLTLKESMILGTAGFTAALCVEKLILNGVQPGGGKVLVTGATGGVGMVAVALLSKLGYKVTASTGKASAHDLLKSMGAQEVVDRSILSDENPRPLLKEEWAGAVDVVGGSTLANVVKSLSYGGSVAACGLVQSTALEATVLPFILRGVNLLGVDSVQLPLETKAAIWEKLANEWKLSNLEEISTDIGFEQLESSLTQVLNGEAKGRFVLDLNA
ncbi:MAG: oxidoreductase [SAR86 cluster bacterium]|uniref:Oxidoreductase n=1 Tax=SAR86 cluster bacterium TaxID=2030880 RepID=A0A2A5BA70_9GAMM|nr:MAG: oxidoreductase [SAR86 cluster bacterium]